MMCLYSKTREPLIAREDIPVYKILSLNIYRLGKDGKHTTGLFTPLFDKPVAVPSTVWCSGKTHVMGTKVHGENLFQIGKGMIHCYRADKDAVMKSYLLTKVTVVAFGHIPEGTPYYEQLDEEIQLCARKIRLERIVAQSEELAAQCALDTIPPLSEWLSQEEEN